jgi:hypothetical protein
VPVLPLFTGVPAEFTLLTDPHPNAGAVDAMARWIAQDLLARGWVSAGAGRGVPDPEERYGKVRSARPTPQLVDDVCAMLDGQVRAALRDVLDWRTADGLAQVYGGVNEDGSAGARLTVLVNRPAGAGTLELELAPVDGRPDLYPLDVRLEADGQSIGTLTIPGEGALRTSVTLPGRDAAAAAAPLELRFVPERWVIAPVRHLEAPVSFRPLRIACTTP